MNSLTRITKKEHFKWLNKAIAVCALTFNFSVSAQSGYYGDLTSQPITSQHIAELDGSTELTFEADFYLNTVKSWTTLLDQQDASTKRIKLMIHNQQLYAIVADGHNTWVRTSSSVITKEKWHHIAMTFDSGNIKIFVDGVQKSTVASGNFSYVPSVAPTTLANFRAGSTKLEGFMDNIRVWDTALSATELSQWRDKTVTSAHPHSSNLLLNWDFEDYSTNTTIAAAQAPAQGTVYTGAASDLNYKRQFVGGYFPHYRMGGSIISENPAPHLTHMFYFSFGSDVNGNLGRVSSTGVFTPMTNISSVASDIAKLKTWQTGTSSKIFVVLGGWVQSDYLDEAMSSAATRATLINQLKSFLIDNDLDGVDVDWEGYNGPVVTSYYASFLQELKSAFVGTGFEISATINPNHTTLASAFAANTDFVQLMTYGQVASGTQYPLSTIKSKVAGWEAAGLSKQKIVIGLPMYSRNSVWGSTPNSVTYRNIVAANPSLSPSTDFVTYSGTSQYFNGIDTITNKSNYAKKDGLQGVMFWEIGQDVPVSDPKSLLVTASDTIGVNPD